MTSDPNTASSRPPPGVAVDPATTDTAPVGASQPSPAPSGSRSGLPDPWGRWLPVLMLVAGMIGLGLLIGTGGDVPSRKNAAPSQSAPLESAPPTAAPQPETQQAAPQTMTQPATPSADAQTEQSLEDPDTSDAITRSATVTAAEAMETCATNSNGSYLACSKNELVAIEPTLATSADALNLTVTSTEESYTIIATSPGSENVFTLAKKADGSANRLCTKSGNAGCTADGTW
ncbi:MAG: hypothetical protein WD118_07240 [Phycisphaeraceae bacterium]